VLLLLLQQVADTTAQTTTYQYGAHFNWISGLALPIDSEFLSGVSTPGGRSGAALAVDAQQNLWVYGGFTQYVEGIQT
jgi:hypothetical protein